MKFCKNCGSPVSRGVVYCPICNCKVDEKLDKTPKVVSSQNIPWYDVSVGQRAKVSSTSSSEKKSISKIYIFIIIFLLLILFLILILL